jgi:hypothetical protein
MATVALGVGVYLALLVVVLAIFCAASKTQPSVPEVFGDSRTRRDEGAVPPEQP